MELSARQPRSVSLQFWVMQPVILALWRLRQEDHRFETSFGFRVCFQIKKEKGREGVSEEGKEGGREGRREVGREGGRGGGRDGGGPGA